MVVGWWDEDFHKLRKDDGIMNYIYQTKIQLFLNCFFSSGVEKSYQLIFVWQQKMEGEINCTYVCFCWG